MNFPRGLENIHWAISGEKTLSREGPPLRSVEIYIVVEGQTEQTFVRDVLAPEMAHKGIFLYPTLIGKPGYKGGVIKFERAKEDIGNFLKQRGNTYISTMFDFFRIDPNWPGRAGILQQIENGLALTAMQKANALEGATLSEILREYPNDNAEKRFIPYIEMHEFEALLFSDGRILAEKTGIGISQINEILAKYTNPEEINDDPAKAPSKRLEALKKGYRKIAMGKTVSAAIGIRTIRTQCPHFNNWLSQIEALSK